MRLGFRAQNGDGYRHIVSEKDRLDSESTCLIRICAALPLSLRKKVLEVCRLVTPEPSRGKGQGSALLSSVCREADRHGKSLVLMVDNGDLDKKTQFYEKFGFNVLQDNGESRILTRAAQ